MTASSKSSMPMSAEANQEVCAIIAANLRTLIKEKGITQRKLAELVGVATATMNDYCSGRRAPQATFLVELRKLYGIDINEFLTSTIRIPTSDIQTPEDSPTESLRKVYGKYCGTYYVYYLDTSKFKGRDTLSPAMSLLHGILYIYEEPSSVGGLQYSCAAVLGISKQEQADELMQRFNASDSSVSILEEIDNNYSRMAYYGSFEIGQEHAFLNLRHPGTDRALAILHRVDSNKDKYLGGIATINSISKGRERMPVLQFFGISRYRLCISPEDIQHALLLSYPIVDVQKEVEEVLRIHRVLFIDNDEARSAFTPDQKKAVIQSTVERAVRRNLIRNAFRYAKISEEDGDVWYHLIKPSAASSEVSK